MYIAAADKIMNSINFINGHRSVASATSVSVWRRPYFYWHILRVKTSAKSRNYTAIVNKKLSCSCDSRLYCVRRTVYNQSIRLYYWQTNKPVSVTSLRTHDPIQRA